MKRRHIVLLSLLTLVCGLWVWIQFGQGGNREQLTSRTTDPREETEPRPPLAAETFESLRQELLADAAAPSENGATAEAETPPPGPAVLEQVLTRQRGEDRTAALKSAAAAWATTEPEEALSWIEERLGGADRLAALDAAIQPWADADVTAAADWVGTMVSDASQARAANALTAQWAATEPEAAADWIATLSSPAVRRAARRGLIDTWSTEDPAAAARWLTDREMAPGDEPLLVQTLERFASANGVAAGEFVAAQRNAAYFPLLAETYLAQTLEREGADAARAWLQAQAFETQDGALARSLFYYWTKLEPAGAGSLLEDPESGLVEPEASAFALMSEWGRTDAYASAEWLSRQPAGPVRDAAIEGFGNALLPYSPEVALTWTQAIADPGLREVQLQALFLDWASDDPVAAGRWLEVASSETISAITGSDETEANAD